MKITEQQNICGHLYCYTTKFVLYQFLLARLRRKLKAYKVTLESVSWVKPVLSVHMRSHEKVAWRGSIP